MSTGFVCRVIVEGDLQITIEDHRGERPLAHAQFERHTRRAFAFELHHMALRTSVPRTSSEEQFLGIFNPFKNGSRVYVTMPGGKRAGFTFRPQPTEGIAGRYLGFHDPLFVSDAGVTSKLSVHKRYTLLPTEDGSFINPEGQPFNPADDIDFGGIYSLSTKDGVAYEIDAQTGDLRVVGDANGNTLTFTDSAIISSAGAQVTFERDSQGRITAVVDPMEQKIRYAYDAKGDLVSVTDREGNVTQFVYDAPKVHYLTR